MPAAAASIPCVERGRTQNGSDGRASVFERVVAVVLLVALLGLHFDWWRDAQAGAMVGWLPAEFAWRLAWMALAFVYLWWFTARFWRADGGRS